MTEPVTHVAALDSINSDRLLGFRTSLLPVFFGLFFLLLMILSEQQPAFHIGFDSTRHGIMVAVFCLTITIAAIFHFAEFSFGYFAGFYLFTTMAGYFWLNAFSVLAYDHTVAAISAIGSIVLFLTPCLLIRAPAQQTFAIPHWALDLLPDTVFCFSVIVLAVCSLNGFHFVGFERMAQYRSELTHSRAVEYAIGNISGALIPFAFACLFARRRWFMLALLVVVSLLYYPVTLTKISLFVAPFLIFVALASSRFEVRTCVILSLLVPLAVGLMAYGLLALKLFTSERLNTILLYTFLTFDFRLLAVPSNSLEHYYAFFSDHPLTHFCQISFLKPIMACPYTAELGSVFADKYRLGSMNASLFATEGVASVGTTFAPLAALAGGFVISIGNRSSAGLPAPFILISSAVIPNILLNVPLSTTLLSHGLGLLFLLWYVTPRDYFGGTKPSRPIS